MTRNREMTADTPSEDNFGEDPRFSVLIHEMSSTHPVIDRLRHRWDSLSAHMEAEALHPNRHKNLYTTIGAGVIALTALAASRHRIV